MLGQLGLDGLDVLDATREHDLRGAVVVGHGDLRPPLRQEGLKLLTIGHDRGHGARGHLSGLRHQLAALTRDAHHVLLVQDAGGIQGHDLAIAVPGDHVGAKAQLGEPMICAQADGAQGGLSPLGARQVSLLLLALLRREDRSRIDDLMQRRLTRRQVHGGDAIPSLASGVHVDGPLIAHVDVLAALAGEEEGHLARDGLAMAILEALRRGQRLVWGSV